MVLPSEETDDHRNHVEHDVKVKGMRKMWKWEQKGNESKNKTYDNKTTKVKVKPNILKWQLIEVLTSYQMVQSYPVIKHHLVTNQNLVIRP